MKLVPRSLNRGFFAFVSDIKRGCKSGLFALICLFGILLLFLLKIEPIHWKHTPILTSTRQINVDDNKPIKIAVWISPKTIGPKWRHELIETMVVKPQSTEDSCFHKNRCEISMSTDALEKADALLFFMFISSYYWETLPPSWESWRKPEQIWVLHADESPINVFGYGVVPPVFNWSISYRRDSDILWHYGKFEPLTNKIPTNAEIMINESVPLSKWISGKSKLVAGVISHCDTNSKRASVIKLLQATGTPVDIYGGCGTLQVRCTFYHSECSSFWNYLARTYKFYLAFENSICMDYITEKFWRTLDLGIVPVVYGGANYTELAPPGSFVDINKFGSADELMSFLEDVGANTVKYAKYFEWKRNFKVGTTGSKYFSGNQNAWCELCDKLHKFKSDSKEMGGGRKSQLPGDWWSRTPKNSRGPLCVLPEHFTLGKWEAFEKQKGNGTKTVFSSGQG